MTVTLHPGARRELEDAAAFYAREGSPALAARFLSEFERVARILAANPAAGAPRTGGRRGFQLTGFPYSVIYAPAAEGLYVLVLKHDRRSPTHGAARR